jgi:hypothetical protein
MAQKTPSKKTAVKPAANKGGTDKRAGGAAARNAPAPSADGAAAANEKPAAKSDGKAAQPKEKSKKLKLVRDSFTMPDMEYQVLGDMKKACIKAGFEIKKSELLRIGVMLIRKMDAAQLKQALAGLTPLKPGRPRKEK